MMPDIFISALHYKYLLEAGGLKYPAAFIPQ